MKNARGMTLIEATVALALLALLSLGILTAFRIGQRSYARVTRADAALADVLAVQRFLRAAVEGSVPMHGEGSSGERASAVAFEGHREMIRFIAAGPLAMNREGLYEYRLRTIHGDRRTRDLIVRAAPLRRKGLLTGAQPWEEVLVRGVLDVRWAFQPRRRGVAADGGESGAWLSDWVDQTELPALVRVEVRFAAGDRRTWPMLIVAPRLTDEAACDFDEIAQSCRSAS